jgi:hypothetical protein
MTNNEPDQSEPLNLDKQQDSPYGSPVGPYTNPYGAAPIPSYTNDPYARNVYSPPAYANNVDLKPTNNNAILSLILSLVGLIGGAVTGILVFTAIPGIIIGHKALREIKISNQQGRGMALAGIIIGYCSLALILLFILIVILFVFLGFAASSY